jgi:hypothetical protein
LEQRPRLCLEILILRRPLGIERRVEHLLQLGACVGLSPVIEHHFREKEVRRRAVRVVVQRLAQVSLGERATAAEQPRHLEVPSSEGAIR